MMGALMEDTILGAVNPDVTNAICNAGGKMLKMVELEYKYGGERMTTKRILAIAGDRVADIPVATS